MPYIGNQGIGSYTSMSKQTITGDGGVNYTLSYAVANSFELAVFVNNVRQEPTAAYGASGTALTMTGNVASTDDFYVIYIGKAIGTIVPPDGSVGTAKIVDGAVTTAKIVDGSVGTAKIASSAVNLTSKVTGVLPVANGGTGVSSGFSYSEGTFTPTWNGYTPYGTSGKYVKIGTQVTVYVTLVTNSGTDESLIQIDNLPFQVAGNQGGGMVDHNSLGLYGYVINTKFTSNSTVCKLFVSAGGAETGIKYVSGSQPTLGGFSTLIWTLVYQTT